ncbi:EamA family transporter [Paracoccus sp. p4-l81]|uniref:EamA family transporter n=1 Tax=Paracoccus sp. p4-l81 TaxID=3342806 RepID=UPI0035B7FBC3
MSLFGLALVLAAAVCHATWNVFVKRINGGAELIWLFSALALLLYLPVAAWVMIVQRPHLGATELAFIAGSVVLHLAYFALLQAGYQRGDLSVVYPTARATGPVLSSAFAVLMLDEVITPRMGLGAAIIVIGVLMLTGGGRGTGQRLGASLGFGLAVGALIGSYTAWDAYAVSVVLIPPLLLDYVSTLGRVVLLTPVALRRRALVARQWRDHRWGVIAIALFSPLAYILVLYALTFTPVAYVAPMREVSVVLVVIAGSLFLAEGHLRQRLTWAAVILAGMVILATA